MNIVEIEQIAIKSVNDPIGCGIPALEELNSLNLYYRFLHNIAKHYKPPFVVECGVDTAGSSLHMILGSPNTQVIGIDRIVNENANAYDKTYPNFTLLVGDTVQENLVEEIKKRCGNIGIGLLFLDSEHDGITSQRELDKYSPLFADECLVCVDDINFNGEMRNFWNRLSGEKIRLDMLHGSGFGASIFRR